MAWTPATLANVLSDLRRRGGDSALVEVKLGAGGVPSLAETLCAFGNMPAGGTVILGVDESRGFTVAGVSNVAAMEAGIATQARTRVTPPVHTDFDVLTIEGKDVVIVTVAGLPSADKPCRTRGKAYLRRADGDYVMSEQEAAQLVAMQDRPRHDAAVVERSSASDLDTDLVRGFLADVRSASRRLADRTDADVLRLRGVTAAETLTVAGLYALGAYPQQFAPSLSITAGASSGNPGQRLVDLAHLDGPIPDLLEQATRWVRRNTRTAVVFGPDGHGSDQPEIPLVAVREFVANALVHRDLSARTQSKRVEIRLLPDRLVINSPGGLWGVSQDQLGEPGGKSAVNEFLYDMCRSIRTAAGHRVIEGEGGGIREATGALLDAGLAEPEFVDTGVAFTVIVYRPSAGTVVRAGPAIASRGQEFSGPGSINAGAVLGALGGESHSIADLVERCGLTRRQVAYALDYLVRTGRVVIDGKPGSRFTTYRPV